MERGLTIGELAKAAGVPISTVRFYKREGRLRASGRSTANYRRPGPLSVTGCPGAFVGEMYARS